MTQQHGRKYEHKITNELDERTPKEVYTTTVGYSGNASGDGSDMLVTIDPHIQTRHDEGQYNLELKKRQGEGGKRTIVFGGSSNGESGLNEIERLVETTPHWSTPVLAIKFDHRKLIVLDARELLKALGEWDAPRSIEHVEYIMEATQPRLTPSDSVSMVKPSLDDWESSQAAESDIVVVAEKLGLPLEDER
jgi:hypothetical protein